MELALAQEFHAGYFLSQCLRQYSQVGAVHVGIDINPEDGLTLAVPDAHIADGAPSSVRGSSPGSSIYSNTQMFSEPTPCLKGVTSAQSTRRRANRRAWKSVTRLEQRGFSSINSSLLLQQAQQEGIPLAGEYG